MVFCWCISFMIVFIVLVFFICCSRVVLNKMFCFVVFIFLVMWVMFCMVMLFLLECVFYILFSILVSLFGCFVSYSSGSVCFFLVSVVCVKFSVLLRKLVICMLCLLGRFSVCVIKIWLILFGR